MAGRTPLACLAILVAIAAAGIFVPVASAGIVCTESLPSCNPMSVTKSGPAYVNAGTSATYTFTVSNNTGFDRFSNVSVTDDKCAPVSGPSGDTNGDSKLDFDETWTYTCTYVPAGVPGDQVQNTVTAQGTGDEYGLVSDSASHFTTLTALRVTKTVDLDTADPYDELNYTIKVTNDGPSFYTYAFYLADEGCSDLQSNEKIGYPSYLPPGATITFTCRHNFNPGSGEGQDSDPYVNEACAYAYVQDNRQVEFARYSIQEANFDLVVCDDASTALAKHTVSGQIFEDMNADGVRQGGEPPLPGVVVYADLNGNGVRDEGEPTSTSDGQGNYSVSVPLGTTTIREDVPSGFTCSFPSGCAYSVDLPKNSAPEPPPVLSRRIAGRATDPTGKDFGDWRPASVTGTVIGDGNSNGARDSGELGLAGIAVFADLDRNGILDQGEPTTTSAADGTYLLAGLKPGGYVIRHVLVQDGRRCTAPTAGCSHSLTLVSGGTAAGKDFLDAKAAQVVLGARIIPGVARMTGKTGCVTGNGFYARIRGQKMQRVVFVLDGRAVKTIVSPRSNRTYRYRVNAARLKFGLHTIAARVTFRANSATKSRTIRLTFQRCAKQLRAPSFTG